MSNRRHIFFHCVIYEFLTSLPEMTYHTYFQQLQYYKTQNINKKF